MIGDVPPGTFNIDDTLIISPIALGNLRLHLGVDFVSFTVSAIVDLGLQQDAIRQSVNLDFVTVAPVRQVLPLLLLRSGFGD